jgi:Domain of unknown function (DUF397)
MDRVDNGTWRKSTYSGGGSSECVEAGVAGRSRVLVRDTTDREGATLDFSAAAWQQFTRHLRS